MKTSTRKSTTHSLTDGKRKVGVKKTDATKSVRSLDDSKVHAAIASDTNSIPIVDDFDDWEIVMPTRKLPLSIRLDEDVLNYFKSIGPRYQTRINEVLRSFMKHQQEKKKA